MFSHLGRLFLTGIIVVLPVTLSVYLLYWLGTSSERLFGSVLEWFFPGSWYVPGSGLFLVIVLILLVGLFMQSPLISNLWRWFDRQLLNVPVFKTVYAAFRDLLDFVSRASAQKPETVVSVSLTDDVSVMGFITRQDLSDLLEGDDVGERVAVYLPMSFQIGGYTVFVPRSKISPVAMDVERALRFTLTGAMTSSDELGLKARN